MKNIPSLIATMFLVGCVSSQSLSKKEINLEIEEHPEIMINKQSSRNSDPYTFYQDTPMKVEFLANRKPENVSVWLRNSLDMRFAIYEGLSPKERTNAVIYTLEPKRIEEARLLTGLSFFPDGKGYVEMSRRGETNVLQSIPFTINTFQRAPIKYSK